MTDRPIIFSAPMVRALIDGRKTQTRRVVIKDIAPDDIEPPYFVPEWSLWVWWDGERAHKAAPFQVGDRLWVREHWKAPEAYDDLAPSEMGGEESVRYIADGTIANAWPGDRTTLFGRHRQAMHMPRWASRLTLIVEDVRVERLADISDNDAIAEGLTYHPQIKCADGVSRSMWFGTPHCGHEALPGAASQAYFDLWDSLHNPRGLCADDEPAGVAANPWVVALTFRVVRGNIDQVAA